MGTQHNLEKGAVLASSMQQLFAGFNLSIGVLLLYRSHWLMVRVYRQRNGLKYYLYHLIQTIPFMTIYDHYAIHLPPINAPNPVFLSKAAALIRVNTVCIYIQIQTVLCRPSFPKKSL